MWTRQGHPGSVARCEQSSSSLYVAAPLLAFVSLKDVVPVRRGKRRSARLPHISKLRLPCFAMSTLPASFSGGSGGMRGANQPVVTPIPSKSDPPLHPCSPLLPLHAERRRPGSPVPVIHWFHRELLCFFFCHWASWDEPAAFEGSVEGCSLDAPDGSGAMMESMLTPGVGEKAGCNRTERIRGAA